MRFDSPHLTQPGRHSGHNPVSPALSYNLATRLPRGSWLLRAALWLVILIAPLAALAQTVGPPILVQALGNGFDGEVIAFHPGDGLIYHASGNSTAVFEKINPLTNAVTPISGNLGTGEIFGMVWYAPLNVFLATDIDSELNHITTAGVATLVGQSVDAMMTAQNIRGLAVIGTRVFGVGAVTNKVYEINPANGAILSETTILLDGNPIERGHSVTTDPVTGQVYAILRQNGVRKIALLNLTTGAATTLAVLGDNFSSLTFVNFGNSDLYGVTGDGNGGPLGSETLYRFTIANRPPQFTPPVLTTSAAGRPNAALGDPAVCLDANGLVGVEATVTNPNNVALAATFTATLPATLTPVAGTCVASINPGGCTIAGNQILWNGQLPAGQTVNIVYRARLAATVTQGQQITINNAATVGGVAAALDYSFNVTCPAPLNVRVSDQKAGSVLVFPYYTSTVGGASDTRFSISNVSNESQANLTRVHLFLIDGATCQQTDLFICLTPNASFSFKASDYDPGMTGYVIAVAVNAQGLPVRNNVLLGNAFVNTPTVTGNYGAESFWANNQLALATIDGPLATLYFDHVGYDAVPKQFAVEIQSPTDAVGQQVVTAALNGNLATSQVSGAAQVGTGQAFNEKEVFASFSTWLTGACQARGTINANSPRVPNGLANLIKTGQTGTLKFNVGAAVGLLLTPRTASWKGIRTLHKTQTVATTLTIPILPPIC